MFRWTRKSCEGYFLDLFDWLFVGMAETGLFGFSFLGATASPKQLPPKNPMTSRSATKEKGLNLLQTSQKEHLPGVTKECFLEALKYLKTSKQHPFETPGKEFFAPKRPTLDPWA